ncbi:polyketide synthase dehydratase domain-containing protein, partial [Mycobacterium szulgai]|uniref:polyketide synthase dehydratase domain-containing protein n=1 Tax=Mycobacterium szulgai TaxID=1787 RepID=UPI0021F29EC1
TPHTRTTALPTYPFQHHRYWLTPATTTNVSTAGLDQPDHPLLGAITCLADQDQIVLSGRISVTSHQWLTGHRVGGAVVFPATGFIDLLLCAGEHAGSPVVDELVLQAPLVLSDGATTDLQITVHPVDDTQQRPVTVHARTHDNYERTPWTLHATGKLSARTAGPPAPTAPPLVGVVDVEGFYQGLAAQGLGYAGPFQAVVGIAEDPADPDTVVA